MSLNNQMPSKIRNIAVIAHEQCIRHPQVGFSSCRAKKCDFLHGLLFPFSGDKS